MAQDVRLRLGIQFEKKESIEKALQFTRYGQGKLRVQILNRSNLKRSKVETNDATGCRKSI